MVAFTVGHGTRSLAELMETLRGAEVETLVDVRRHPGSRRHPQFNRLSLADALTGAGIAYRHAVELGGRRADEPGAERFDCIRTRAFRGYAARIERPEWRRALDDAVTAPTACFLCAETDWTRCHRKLIADVLAARGLEVVHLLAPGVREPHRLSQGAEVRAGKLFVCGEPVW